MIKIKTTVMLDGTDCLVWKEYYKNGHLIGFAIIASTYTSVHFYKKDGCESRFTR